MVKRAPSLVLPLVLLLSQACVDPVDYGQIAGEAVDKGDISLCELIKGDGYREVCTRAACREGVVKSENDSSMCGKLEDESQFAGKGCSDYVKSSCYTDMAYMKADPSYCENIPDADLRDQCFGKAVLVSYDSSVCVKIVGDYYKTNCFEFLAAVVDPALCEKIADHREYCYNNAAVKRKDPMLCAKIGRSGRDECYLGVALARNDSGICGLCEGSDYRNLCTAQTTKRYWFCDQIKTAYLRDDCYSDAAKTFQNPSMCDMINETGSQKDHCFIDRAIERNDPSICEKVGPDERSRCFGLFSGETESAMQMASSGRERQ